MTPVMPLLRAPAESREAVAVSPGPLDVQAIRGHFAFPELGRIVTNNAASTQPPRALDGLGRIPALTIYGPRDAARRTSLVAFNLGRRDPVGVAEALNRAGVESRAGCHCATLAHHALRLNPPASCRLSFYLYNTPDEVDTAVAEVAAIASGRRDRSLRRWREAPWRAPRRRAPTGPARRAAELLAD